MAERGAAIGGLVTVTGSTTDTDVTLSARLSLKRWSGETRSDASVDIALVKGEGNTYSGTYTLVEGDAQVVDASVTATRDSQSNSKSAGQSPVDVGARFVVDSVDLHGGSGFRMALAGRTNGNTVRQDVTDSTPFTLSPVAPGTYDLGLFDDSGRPRRESSVITLLAGRTTHGSLTATPLASLAVHVSGDGGDMAGTSVTVYDGAALTSVLTSDSSNFAAVNDVRIENL